MTFTLIVLYLYFGFFWTVWEDVDNPLKALFTVFLWPIDIAIKIF